MSSRRMNGMDAAFIYLEGKAQPMTNTYLFMLGKSPDPLMGPITLDELREHISVRLDSVPSLRWRVVPTPLHLNHPLYMDDPDFSIANHVTSVTLPSPGNAGQLNDLVAKYGGVELDRSMPLWGIMLVDGVEGDGQALIFRGHHCMFDGISTMVTLGRLFSPDPLGQSDEAPPYTPQPIPSTGTLAWNGWKEQLVNSKGFIKLTVKAAEEAKAARSYFDSTDEPRPRYRDMPRTVFNSSGGAGRIYARGLFELSDISRVRRAAGVTFTDVILATVSGGMRAVLGKRGELPEQALITAVPTGLASGDTSPRQWGNKFAGMTASLATNVEDPWDRLHEISRVAKITKRGVDLAGETMWTALSDKVPGFAMKAALMLNSAKCKRSKKHPNTPVLVSNVRGPEEKLVLAGRPINEFYITGPPNSGTGAVLGFISYGDKMSVGCFSIQGTLDDPEFFVEAMKESLAELVEIADRVATEPQSSIGQGN